MPSTARAARWTAERTIEVTDKAVRDPAPDEVRVAVGSAGICGSDLHFYRGEFPATPGITPGHEFGGTVEAVGADVRHVREGDLVGIEPLLRCGLCPFCLSGDYHVCNDRGLVGQGVDGGMSESATLPGNTVFPAPSGLDAEGVALAEPLACSVHGFEKVKLRGHETVFIVGAVSICLSGILGARAGGAQAIVLARHPHQQEAARRLGAVEVIGDDDAGKERMAELARIHAVDVAVETVGGTADTLITAQRVVRPKGRVVLLGIFTGTRTSIDPLHLALNEVEVVGAVTYAASDGHADYAVALDVVADHADAARSLVTHRFALDDAGQAFDTAVDKSTRSIKVHIQPGTHG